MDPTLRNKLLPILESEKAGFDNISRPDRIVDVTRQCIVLFGRVCNIRSLDARTRSDAENQLGRFKIWVGTIGVFAVGKASADARLKEDKDVKDVMIDMLLRLRRTLDEFLKPVIVEEPEDDDEAEPSDSSSESEASLILSIGDESDSNTAESKTSNQQTASLQEIDSIIAKLYRLSAIIRKPISTHENVRVASFIERVEDGPEAADFESHVRWQVKHRLPDASEKIIDRLVTTVVFRRKKLKYRERHQKKLSQGLEAEFRTAVVLPVADPALQRSRIRTPRQNSPFLNSAATVKSLSTSIVLSGTEASAVNRRALASYPKSLAGGSNITKSAIARRDQLDIPPPPKILGTSEAICPYCFEVVEKAKMARPIWTRHILKDIEPYVCLFETCSKANEQYQSYDDWIMHMKWQHTLVWTCQAPRHLHLKFDTAGECEQHMHQEHAADFSASQLAVLVEKSAQPAADPLDVIIRDDEATPAERCICPFCAFSVARGSDPDPSSLVADTSTPTYGSAREMRDHIVAHLESIALLSLPEQEDLDNAASDEVQSESARASSRDGDESLAPVFRTDIEWEEHNWQQEQEQEIPDALATSVVFWDDSIDMMENAIWNHVTDDRAEAVALEVEYEDWLYVTSKTRSRTPAVDPGQDPVLIPFVERFRRIQTLELQKRLGIPLLVVSDPEGLEVPERRWAGDPDQLSTHAATPTQLHNIGPNSPAEAQRSRYDHEKYSDFFALPEDDEPTAVVGSVQEVPKIVLNKREGSKATARSR